MEIDCGAHLALKVRVVCLAGCDLRRALVRVVGADGEIATLELARHDGTGNETEELLVSAPQEVGEHAWAVVFACSDIQGAVHEESALPLRFRTRPHATSMSAWGAPTPVVVGSGFDAKIGVKCSAGCRLAGQTVHVRDEAGGVIGQGRLGGAPWPGTRGLYVAEVSLRAPAREQVSRWYGTFSGDRLPLPHENASAPFSFPTAKPPEHGVVVEVTERDAGAPLEGIEVFMGMYQATTDDRGLAELNLPKGAYTLVVRKHGVEADSMRVHVDRDDRIAIRARLVPEANPDEEEVWM